MKLHWIEVEELALAVIGEYGMELEPGEVETRLFEKLGVDMEQFHAIAEALIDFVPEVKTAISGEEVKAFVYNGVIICRGER